MTDIVVRKPDIQGGEPCIAGTRVTVAAIQSWAASGFDNERIKQEYPGLTDDQIDAARAYKMPPVTDIDLDKLEALAEAATPGEWYAVGGYLTVRDPDGSFQTSIYHLDEMGQKSALSPFQAVPFARSKDAAFIAAANPATILSLIASAREAAAEIDRLREAMTASGATKAAYHGEFKFTQVGRDEDGDEYTYETYVPWTTVKEIMAAIRARANPPQPQKGEEG